MPEYNYRARDWSGQAVSGLVAAEDERQARERLRAEGLIITGLELNRDLTRTMRRLKEARRGGRRIPARELAQWARQMSTMLAAGVTLVSTLHMLARQNARRPLGGLLEQIAREIEGGASLSEAFGRHERELPPILISLVAAGETSGVLDAVLARAADHFERQHALGQKVRTALTYPLIVAVVAAGVVTFLVTFVLPTFADMFLQAGKELPLPTQIVLGLNHWLRTYGWWMLPLLAAGVWYAVRRYSATPQGALAIDRWLLRVPFFGEMLRLRAVAVFARILALLLHSGVPVLASLTVAERTLGNRVLAEPVQRSRQAVELGRNLSEAIRESPDYPAMLGDMLAVGEETGETDAMLARAADYFERQVETMAERMAVVIEPVMVVVIGLIVGFVIIAMVLPMFDSWSLFSSGGGL